jgi:PKD repeat protein
VGIMPDVLGGPGHTGGGNGGGKTAEGTAGSASTGGGGGGGRGVSTPYTGYNGGTGVVVVKYLATPPTPPATAFSANVTAGATPLSVGFTDESENSPTSWEWSWDDGTANSTSQSPVHTFTSAGVYTVTLTATNDDGSDTEQKIDYITAVDPPLAAFSANATNGASPLSVGFTDESENSPTSWEWDLNADGITDSTDQNPDYTYPSPGSYAVKLTVSNIAGSDSETRNGYISVFSSVPTTARPTTAPTTAPATTAIPESLDEIMQHVQEILPNFINMVSASISGFLIIGVVMVVIGLFANLKGVLFRLLRRRKW